MNNQYGAMGLITGALKCIAETARDLMEGLRLGFIYSIDKDNIPELGDTLSLKFRLPKNKER